MKDVGKKPDVMLKTFLNDNNDSFIEFDGYKGTFGRIEEITADDEIWFLQAPSSLNLDQLKHEKIKLNSELNRNSIEIVSQKNSNEKMVCLGFSNKTNRFHLRQAKVAGTILMRKNLITIKNEENEDSKSISYRVPFPNDLKDRHPLHGVHYEKKINLKPSLLKRFSEIEKARKVKKNKKISNIKSRISDTEISNLSIEKVKKSKKKKNKEISEDSNDDVDVAWIKNT